MKEPAVIFWSGGKDSALALWETRLAGDCEAVALLTTLNENENRSGMHRVRRELLEQQAAALGLPIHFIPLPAFPPNSVYEDRVRSAIRPFLLQGVRRAVFGDLFLPDIRTYREQLFRPLGVETVYPLWQRDTGRLARDFIARGFRAVLVCVNTAVLDQHFTGRLFDNALLAELPAGVDPCGENEEFHTFVFNGPIFSKPVVINVGVKTKQNSFSYCELTGVSVP